MEKLNREYLSRLERLALQGKLNQYMILVEEYYYWRKNNA